MLRVLLLCVAVALSLDAGAATRARDLGVPFHGMPGACLRSSVVMRAA